MKQNQYKTAYSQVLHERAKRCIAQGALTNSKRPESLVLGVYPTHIRRAEGCYVTDEFENRYVDFIGGLGTSLLGYGHESISRRVIERIGLGGPSYSLPSLLECELAEKLKQIYPFTERWKFFKSGTEACQVALRIARAYTGQPFVRSEGYHGHGDEFTALNPPAHGCPEAPYLSKGMLEGAKIAILEPVDLDWDTRRKEGLHNLREKITRAQGCLIFDEIITGLRWPKFGVSTYWGIEPDIIVIGKALGNGYPIAAVGGKASVMECQEYFASGTFCGDTIAIAAALATLTELQTKSRIDELWAKGEAFQLRFNSMKPWIQLRGYPTRARFEGHDMKKALFFQEACKAGYLLGPSFFLSFPHIPILNDTLDNFERILHRIDQGEVKLEGELPRSPFAQKVRENEHVRSGAV